MVIALWAGRQRAAMPEYLAAHLDKLGNAVAGLIFGWLEFQRLGHLVTLHTPKRGRRLNFWNFSVLKFK
jgi:hypothetical protein